MQSGAGRLSTVGPPLTGPDLPPGTATGPPGGIHCRAWQAAAAGVLTSFSVKRCTRFLRVAHSTRQSDA